MRWQPGCLEDLESRNDNVDIHVEKNDTHTNNYESEHAQAYSAESPTENVCNDGVGVMRQAVVRMPT